MRVERAARGRIGAIAASAVVHVAILGAWIALPPRGAEPPRPPADAVEVRLVAPAPRALVSPRPPATPGPRREGRAPRHGRSMRPLTDRPGRGAPGPATTAALDTPLLAPGSGDVAEVAFAGHAGFPPRLDAEVSPGAAAAPAAAPGWLRRHQRAIERRIQFAMNTLPYPPDARRRGWKGEVVVAFRLGTDGTARDVRVARSSGHAVLDRCAVEAVLITPRFPRPPVEQDVEVPFEFRLRPG